MTDGLRRSHLDRLPLLGAPAPAATGIVHLGLGNFHRAHQAVHTAAALAVEPGGWGIVGVANRSRRVVDALSDQDGLYSVLELDAAGVGVGIVDVHRRFRVVAEEARTVVDDLASARHRVITATVTEHGYHLGPDSRLQLDHPDVVADLRTDTPATTIGLLARGLQRRAATHRSPVGVVSCDNLQGNGRLTRQAVLDFLTAARAADDEIAWIADHVGFPDSMVDRIVPATTDAVRARVAEELGVHDAAPVAAEAFSMWVVRDEFPAGRPAWEHTGVVFTDQVDRYEVIKLRLLNGTHSLLAYLGALDGRETIPAARDQDFIEAAARAAIAEEYLPTITAPDGFDVDGYVEGLFRRWTNAPLAHRVDQVGSDGSAKLPQRLPVAALAALDVGRMPNRLALTVAAWLCCVAPPDGFDPGPYAATMAEPDRERLASVMATAASPGAGARAVVTGGALGAELADRPAFVDRVGELTDLLVRHGVRAATAEAMAAPGDDTATARAHR